jgi:hypothetical protein
MILQLGAIDDAEYYAFFRIHLGPRFTAAGVGVQFHYNQKPGIHFKVEVREEYRRGILKGITEGLATRFPDFPSSASIWVTVVTQHIVDSSEDAFYQAARLAIEQAYSRKNIFVKI